MKTKKTTIIISALIILGICLCAVVFFSNDSTETPTVKTSADYVSEYGGKAQAYDEIFALKDCAELQKKFELASANNQREEAGTPAFKWTLGYMTAAEDRMREIGCYK